MALSVVKRPLSLKTSTTGNSATVPSGYSANVAVYSPSHGLSTGNYVYITSDYGYINGFWYVSIIDTDYFNIREYPTASNLVYVENSATVSLTWYSCYVGNNSDSWDAVHNPIVYKLASTLWPINSVDTARTVSSYSNDLGYAKLTLSGSLGTISELEFVKVTFTGGDTAVYQVLTWYSNSIVTINLPYVGGLTFVSVQKYYTDYHAKVRVYAGLVSTHDFAEYKPYELICEIKAVPDSSGIVTININEYLKERVSILKNSINSATLPNDVDSFCQFYITYAEAYSYAEGGYTLQDYIGSYTDDSGNGNLYAVNASMPFKNRYSGMMSDYLVLPNPLSGTFKFLTPLSEPTLCHINDNVSGPISQFFDISFIRTWSLSTRCKREVYKNGQIVNVYFDTISFLGIGIYKHEISVSSYLEDRIDVTIQAESGGNWFSLSETKTIIVDGSCSPSDNFIDLSWKNNLGGMDYWRFKSFSEYGVDILKTTEADQNFYPTWPNSWGEDADTLSQETSRESVQTLTVRAENLTETQVQDLFRIKLSPLVQIVNSRTDRRTVIPDKSSFVYFKEGEKNYSMTLTLTYTDKFPAQSL